MQLFRADTISVGDSAEAPHPCCTNASRPRRRYAAYCVLRLTKSSTISCARLSPARYPPVPSGPLTFAPSLPTPAVVDPAAREDRVAGLGSDSRRTLPGSCGRLRGAGSGAASAGGAGAALVEAAAGSTGARRAGTLRARFAGGAELASSVAARLEAIVERAARSARRPRIQFATCAHRPRHGGSATVSSLLSDSACVSLESSGVGISRVACRPAASTRPTARASHVGDG